MSAAIDDNTPRNNSFNPPTIARYLYFLSGILVTVNGFVSIGSDFNGLNQCQGGSNCIGPSLAWGSFTGGTGDGQNVAWRDVFSLNPEAFFLNWTGVFLGLIMILVHFPGFKFSFCTRTWLHVSFFSLFTVLFGCFPYAGNLGIIIGFLVLVLTVISFVLVFTRYRHEPTTLLIRLERFHMGCLANNELILTITRVCSFVAGIAVMVVGFIHVFVTNFNWCPDPTTNQCVGPSLRWNPSGSNFINEINLSSGWGTIFTFVPQLFFPLWGPIILGWITVLQHIEGHEWPSISVSWGRVFVWFMFLGLFSGLGYAGNLGIIVGFFCILIALLALLIAFGGGTTARTHLSIHVRYFSGTSKVKVTGAGQSFILQYDQPSYQLIGNQLMETEIRANSRLNLV